MPRALILVHAAGEPPDAASALEAVTATAGRHATTVDRHAGAYDLSLVVDVRSPDRLATLVADLQALPEVARTLTLPIVPAPEETT